ncbi:CRISPR-associated endoribonuclease Cas6 [Phorcysia thermohydrogeniphila]|uniref:CRISPR-associated Cas6 family protein n=1 Tax=Phorcysia thermohydrogeniphila TaxID=936138 RepID=A0A4R1GGY2_9BACT|nr:CRISPR-associated endoribonuclease Cas6 [Phorcysia thermohydrogeniphila]TCK06223.1 CRISPR-associated Cas6 family protein [Phorcysia thermohydrogeniphila]
MPVKLLLKFGLSSPVKVSSLKPKVIHGIFFSLFQKNKEVGELLHSPSLKPFTLFFPAYFRKPEEEVTSFTLELNLLNNELFPEVARVLFFEKELEVSVNGVKAELRSLKPVLVETYEGMLKGSSPKRDIVLDFLTPTSFRKKDADLVLPEPYLVFRNLLRRWNAFSPIKIPPRELISFVKENLFVSGCWIKTKKVEIMNEAKITGFMGRVYFYAFKEEPEALKALNALCRFSEFSGVGRKTTMGFGKVRWERENESFEE